MFRRGGKTSLEVPIESTRGIQIDCLIPDDVIQNAVFKQSVQRDIIPHVHKALAQMANENPKPSDPINYLKTKIGFIPAPEKQYREIMRQVEMENKRHEALLSLVIKLRAQLEKLEQEKRAREAATPAPVAPEEPGSPLMFNPRFQERWDQFFAPK